MACQEPLGIEFGNVTSDQLTASSFNGSFQAANAILNQEGAWVPATNDQHQWFQIDLYRQILVSGVVIQGRSYVKRWVTRYWVKYALDGVSWEDVTDNSTSEVCNLRNKTKLCYIFLYLQLPAENQASSNSANALNLNKTYMNLKKSGFTCRRENRKTRQKLAEVCMDWKPNAYMAPGHSTCFPYLQQPC